MRRRLISAFVLLLCVGAAVTGVASSAQAPSQAPPHVVTDPFDPRQQTDLAFGERSHWLQPWRAYQQTVPSTRLLSATGIHFDVQPKDAERVARLLAAAGVHRVRYEIGWCNVDYAAPAHFTNPAGIREVLGAFKRNGLRPLLLLNAHHGCPGPLKRFSIRVIAPARAGARQLSLDANSAAQVVPSLTGLDSTTQYKAAATLFTGVAGDAVSLSKPLASDLTPGTYPATTLRYAPFAQVGSPSFERTLAGWLDYVGLVAREAKAILGSDDFDVEVWNELTFGSNFLDINDYYTPPLASVDLNQTEQQILARTVAFLRNPANGVAHVGIGDGFANQRPWDSGVTVPAGVTAIDKHPYAGPLRFPQQAAFNGVRPLDARGHPDGSKDASGLWRDTFVPHYMALFPEYYLTGIQTEHLVRDLSPITTYVYGTPHGRYVHAPAAAPPAIWLTEAGLDPTTVPSFALPRFKAKEALRYLVSWVNRGAGAVYLFAARDVDGAPWAMVNTGAPDGGLALRALGRLAHSLRPGSGPITRPASVTLKAIGDYGHRVQFEGDGTTAHPPLYDRDDLAFFPFQISNSRAAVAVYVMSRNMLRLYRPGLGQKDPRRFDLPPERFRLTIAGVANLGGHVAAMDPLTGQSIPVEVVSRRKGVLVVELAVTDSPRLLLLG